MKRAHRARRRKPKTTRRAAARKPRPRRRRTTAHRRRARRSNPAPATLLLANPRRTRRRRATVHHRRRRRTVHALAGRRHRKGARLHRRRRRSNPMRLHGIWSIGRIALFGGMGIIVARIGAYLYGKFASDFVLGDAKSDPTSWRHTLNEALRLAAMGIITIGVERGLRMARLRPEDCRAFLIGGLAETGRQTVGLVVKKVSPGFDRGWVGLDGPTDKGDGVNAFVDEKGQVWALQPETQRWQLAGIMDREDLAGLMNRTDLAGAAA